MGENAAQEALHLDKANELPEKATNLGQPKKKIDTEYKSAIRCVTLEGNKAGTSVSTKLIQEILWQQYDVHVSAAMLR